jgi:dipeptidyl aminopeptidase/acylaminoacyl peptidase
MRKILVIALLGLLLPVAPAAAARTIDVTDVVQVRQIPETRIAQDGRRVAFVVNEPSVADNKVTSRLMVAEAETPDQARTLVTLDRISNLGWSPDGCSITFLAAADGADELWSVPVTGGKPRKLFDSPAPAVPIGGERLAFYDAVTPPHQATVLRHQWSSTGLVAFTTPHLVAPAASEGVVYDERSLGIQSLIEGQYGSARVGVWVFDSAAQRPRHLIDLDLGAQGRLGPTLAWSADNTRLELLFPGKSWVLDVRTGELVDAQPGKPPTPPVVNSKDSFDAWSYDNANRRAAAVRQNAVTPPRLVVVDAQAGVVRDGYNPNAAFAGVQLQPPVPAEWVDAHGHKAGGYQLVPPGCGAGKRCPAIVITHGYDAAANRFMWAGHEWQYPSQVFAAKGYVVLAVDESRSAPSGPGNDWPESLRNMLEPVAMMEAAVKSGVDGGYIDPDRVGIAGYSRGAEVTQLAVSHSTVFKAASSGEGGNGTVGYWLFGAQNPYAADQAQQLFGGSPVDPQASARWRDYAADLRADQINTPLLMQDAEPNSVANLPLRSYLKARNIPAELTIFPDETHLFHQPAHRAAAMRQNLDWFDYWLLNTRDPAPAKKAQYARWDTMRTAWQRS